MTGDGREIRERLTEFLSQKYRGPSARKRLASQVKCSESAARNMLRGMWPSAKNFQALVRQFGDDFYLAIIAPDLDAAYAQQQKEIRELELRLAHLKESAPRLAISQSRRPQMADRGP